LRLTLSLALIAGCGYSVGPMQRAVQVDVVNQTLHRGLAVHLRRCLVEALTQRGILTNSGRRALVTIVSVKGRPTFEVARTVLQGEITVMATVRLGTKSRKFSATQPFSSGAMEESQRLAVSELADAIAEWLACQN